jgi:hypothetical protein
MLSISELSIAGCSFTDTKSDALKVLASNQKCAGLLTTAATSLFGAELTAVATRPRRARKVTVKLMQVLALSDFLRNLHGLPSCTTMMQHCNCLPIVAALLLQACCTHAFFAPAPVHIRSMQYAARCTMSSSSEPREQSTGVSRRDLFSGKPIDI